jgi:hypothetical protein
MAVPGMFIVCLLFFATREQHYGGKAGGGQETENIFCLHN